jgi:hypothetical protein
MGASTDAAPRLVTCTLFHIYHPYPIIDVAHIHLMDYLIPIPLWNALVYALPPMYFYIRSPLLAL